MLSLKITTDCQQLLLQEINHFCQVLEGGRGCLNIVSTMVAAKVTAKVLLVYEESGEVETHP